MTAEDALKELIEEVQRSHKETREKINRSDSATIVSCLLVNQELLLAIIAQLRAVEMAILTNPTR